MLTVKLILERLDREGRLLEKREQLSKSFTIGLIELLYVAHAQISSGSPYSMTDIGGTPRDVDSLAASVNNKHAKGTLIMGAPPGNSQQFLFPGGDTSYATDPARVCEEGNKLGIQAGTGSVAVTPTDTELATRINHGRSAGQLEYGGCELIGIAFSDPDGEFTIRRYFTNASGGSITVNEVGIHAVGSDGTTGVNAGAWSFLVARDVVAPGVAVANGEILRVTYVPQITV